MLKKPSENKNIEPHQNCTGSYEKKCTVSMWVD